MMMWSEVVEVYYRIERSCLVERVEVTRWWWSNGTTTYTEKVRYAHYE